MFIPDPGSSFLPIPDPESRIPDPKTATKERGENIFCRTFFCSHKFHKIVKLFYFWKAEEKICVSFQRIIELFTQKFVIKLSKDGFGIRNPGSEIRDPEKTYFGSRIPDQGPAVKKAPDPGSGSATLEKSY